MNAVISARERLLLAALAAAAVLAGLYYDQRLPAGSGRVSPAALPALAAPAAPESRAPEAPREKPAEARVEVTHFRVGQRNVKSIYADAGAVWVGTSDGLIRYDVSKDRTELFDRKDGLPSSSVFFVGRARGQMLAATAGGGLSAFDERERRWSRYAGGEALAGTVLDMLETRGGELWIATLSGVARVPAGDAGDAERWQRYTVHSTSGGLPGQPVYGVAEGRRGEIWLATEAGVARFRHGRWESWKFDGAQRVLAVKVDARGVVWAGTWGGGLHSFDGKSWRAYTRAQGLPGDFVLSLHAESRGPLWIGTDKGVVRMHNGRLEKKLRAADGLLEQKVLALATGSDGSLWVGGFGGVTRLRPVGRL